MVEVLAGVDYKNIHELDYRNSKKGSDIFHALISKTSEH